MSVFISHDVDIFFILFLSVSISVIEIEVNLIAVINVGKVFCSQCGHHLFPMNIF